MPPGSTFLGLDIAPFILQSLVLLHYKPTYRPKQPNGQTANSQPTNNQTAKQPNSQASNQPNSQAAKQPRGMAAQNPK
jgi:hypothetical protein